MTFHYPPQGHKIVLGWDNVPTLQEWTAYADASGRRFYPPYDRDGYSDGVPQRVGTGAVLQSGFPIVRLTFPWVSYAQVDYLVDTFRGQNVTAAIHKPTSHTRDDVYDYNAVLNIDLNQVAALVRKQDGYEKFVVELVLVEPL